MTPALSGTISAADYLTGNGEMANLIRSKNWAATPLGPIELWPQSLRTTVSLCVGSNFPINIVWGPRHTQIYNDGYRVVCGDAHPEALGQAYNVTWASAWPAIGEPFARALEGETSFLENQRMFLTRNGYLEETFFTFSTSPIRDESGGIGGLFHPVTETTAMMLAERRTRALRDLTGGLGAVNTLDRLPSETIRILSAFNFDLPFVLIYEAAADGITYRLTGSCGLPAGSAAAPAVLASAANRPWPMKDAAGLGTMIQVNDVTSLVAGAPCGPYEEPPDKAFVWPVKLPGVDQPPAILIMGVSSRLPMHDIYRGFYELLGAAMSAAFATIRAHEDERRRSEALAALDHAKTVFFSNVSHEFRTPLALLLGPLEDVLQDADALPRLRREQLEAAYRNGLRLLRLVNTLLDFSRIEAGRVQARFEPANLAATTRELVANFESVFERANLTLDVDCPQLPRPVHVDRDMWEKIVLNLVSNAFKFTLKGGASISLRDDGPDVVLTVRDTGVGISAQELPRLFERFHRIEGQAARTHEGSGIGLALVQELVSLHHGSIVADSVEGQGTSFRVRLPYGLSHGPPGPLPKEPFVAPTSMPATAFVEEALRWLPDEAAVKPAAPPVGASEIINGAARVLIADDNADMRAYIRRILEGGGYAVEAVANGGEALAALRHGQPPDLIVSDVMMPKVDGFQLLRVLRADPLLEALPVILLSARAGEEAKVEGLAAGADDYLVKPFAARELRARVDAVIRLARQRREAAARERALQTELATAQSRAALRETEQQLDLALKAGRLGSWELDLATGHLLVSDICRANFGWKPGDECSFQRLLDSVFPADRPLQQKMIADAIENHTDLDIEYRTLLPDDAVGWVMVRGRAAYAEDGTPLVMAGVSLDITDRKKVEQRQRLLLNELNHRVKNTLATVQSIARQTRRTAVTSHEFDDAFASRIDALARAHDILTGSAWEGAMLAAIIAQTLAPYARPNGDEDRIVFGGPPVRLGPNAAVTLNMAFHELATNAAKYGSLSASTGRLHVTWTVDRSTEPAMLDVTWTESDGPPVAPPTRSGFGTRLLRSGLPRELSGSVTMNIDSGGFMCRMRVAISNKISVMD
jgi:signal transduction histidine kinase/DNA-binding response OmpR family regulator